MDSKELDRYLIGEAWTSTDAYANLEALCERLLATQPRYATDSEEGLARDAFRRRYAALAEFCRQCEESLSPNGILGSVLADRLETIAHDLGDSGDRLERCRFNPIETMPTVVAVRREASLAEEMADRIGIIHQGRLIALGTPQQLRQQSGAEGPLEQAFLALTGSSIRDESASSTDQMRQFVKMWRK